MFNSVLTKIRFNESKNLTSAAVGEQQAANGAVISALPTDAVHLVEQVAERIGRQVAGRGEYLSRDEVDEGVGVGIAIAAESVKVDVIGGHRAEPPSM